MSIDEKAIDRKLMAGLIARHGEPPRAEPPTRDQVERREAIARRDRALAAADPAFLARLEQRDVDAGHWRDAQVERSAGLLRTEQALARFDLDLWQLREADEARELEPSDEIRDALEECAPQAFLRDLHRPVQMFGEVELRRIASPTGAAALSRGRDAVMAAMRDRAGAAGRLSLASREAHAGVAEMRETLARPWEEARPATPLPMPSRAPSFEDMQWFGLSGGYDPDV